MRQAIGTKAWGYMHRKLKRKVYIYLAIFIVMAGISIYDIAVGYIQFALAFAGWLMGMLIGYLSGRATKILWEEDSELVISKRDTKGIIILIVYILFALTRKELFGQWFHGAVLTALCFCIVAGIRLGRIVRLRRKIRKVIEHEGVA